MATILVIDDEPDIRFLLTISLEMAGHVVVTADDGEQALAIASETAPDVVILDLNMPKLDGWGVLDAVKSHPEHPIHRVPVLVLSALDSDEVRVRTGVEGALRHLTKPVSMERLLEEIDEALSGDPEPDKRRRVQASALRGLARLQVGHDPDEPAGPLPPAPRLARLEHHVPKPTLDRAQQRMRDSFRDLTPRQQDMMRAVAQAPSVTAAAERLGVSRANVYAGLRRVARRLDVDTVPTLLDHVRSGLFDV